MSDINDYRDLLAWQRAMQLARVCFQIVRFTPRWQTRGISSQLLKSANSVHANIAEGHGRPTTKDYLKFLGMSHRSLREAESHIRELEFARDVHGPRIDLALDLADQCGRLLTNLRRSLGGRRARGRSR